MLPRFDEAYDATDSRCKTEKSWQWAEKDIFGLMEFCVILLGFSIYMESYANTFFARRIATGILWP